MSRARPQAIFPGDVRQVAHMVPDLDAAIEEWTALGVGPWTVLEVTQAGSHFRGLASTPSTSIGFANVGAMQIELIAATGAGPSVWHEARDAGRFGPHHIAYWADDFDAALATIDRAGLSVVQDGDGNGMARFVYVETPSGSLIEVMELNDMTRAFMDAIRANSENWTG